MDGEIEDFQKMTRDRSPRVFLIREGKERLGNGWVGGRKGV